MLHYVKSFTMQVVPSVAATIIGAYIVNHYIATPKPGSETPTASIVRHKAKPAPEKPALEAKPAETSGDVASLPEAGVKAKGISEKALLEKNAAAEKAVVEKPAVDKPAEKEKSADKPAETASLPAEPRRQQAAPREKTAAIRVIPLTPSQPATPAAPAPVVAAPASAPAVETAPEERRDANDLARAAIERLRGDGAPRTQAAARAPETSKNEASRNEASRNPEGSRTSEASTPQALRPLPPPIMVSAPPSDAVDPATSQPRPPYANNARSEDPMRPTPPAEIPTARPPLDLRAEMAPREPREKPSVADEMLSAAKSMFQNVMPK